MKIQTAIKEYLIEIEVRKYTPRTIKGYRTNLNLFLRFCQEKSKIDDVEDITLGVVKQLTQLTVKPPTPKRVKAQRLPLPK